VIDLEGAASMSPADHRRGLAAAMAVLIAEFNTYLDREGADPVADSVGYRQGTLWLSPDELAEMAEEMRRILQPRAGNQPSPDRAPYLLSAILSPPGSRPSRNRTVDRLPPATCQFTAPHQRHYDAAVRVVARDRLRRP